MVSCFSPFSVCSFFFLTINQWFTPDQPSGIAQLPDELMLQIFSSLSIRDLATAGLVCRKWQRISLDDQLWLNFYQKHFHNLEIDYIDDMKSFFRHSVSSEKMYRIINNPQLLKIYGIAADTDTMHFPDLLTTASDWQKRRWG